MTKTISNKALILIAMRPQLKELHPNHHGMIIQIIIIMAMEMWHRIPPKEQLHKDQIPIRTIDRQTPIKTPQIITTTIIETLQPSHL